MAERPGWRHGICGEHHPPDVVCPLTGLVPFDPRTDEALDRLERGDPAPLTWPTDSPPNAPSPAGS